MAGAVAVEKGLRRTGKQMLDAIPAALARRDAFIERVKQAANRDECSALMAEAIDTLIEVNGLDVVGHDGRVRMSPEEVFALHGLVAARKAYGAFVNAAPPNGGAAESRIAHPGRVSMLL